VLAYSIKVICCSSFMKRVSVVYPVFGNISEQQLEAVLSSVTNQDYSNIEIVLSEENPNSRFKTIANKFGATYVFNKTNGFEYNIGRVRNAGLHAASGTYVYSSDADIVFLRSDYISRLVKQYKISGKAYLSFPPMKRLLKVDQTSFYNDVSNHGLERAITALNFSDGYTTNSNPDKKLKVLRYGYYKKRYTIFTEEFKKISSAELKKYGYGLLHFTYHAGTIFTTAKALQAVGGYYENHDGWGGDDVYVQVKLGKYFKSKKGHLRSSIPKTSVFTVLHLDHKKRFSKQKYQDNQDVLWNRLARDYKKIIAEDRKENGF